MSQFLDIDGSILEGGGQILRISISLSAILGIPVRVTKIRAGRSKPGLAAQHLKGIQLVSEMCQGRLRGDAIGSTEIEFTPGKLRGGCFTADTHTAGSVSLLLQVALPCGLLAPHPVSLELRGGTNAEMAPQIDYMTEVFRHTLRKFGGDFQFEVHRRGYFPRGGGRVTVEISPVQGFKSVNLTERGRIERIYGWSMVAGTLPIKVAYQMANAAKQLLSQHGEVNIDCYKEEQHYAPDNCSGIIVACDLSSGVVVCGDGLGARGAEPALAGRRAARLLHDVLESGACVDTYLQDQIIIYMALAEGSSAVRVSDVTLHTQTAMHIAELIAKTKFTVRPDGDHNIIECTGLGFKNTSLVT